MIWITVLFGVLSLLLQWLISRRNSGKPPTEKQKKKIGRILDLANKVQTEATAMGITPYTGPDDDDDPFEDEGQMASDPGTVDQMRVALLGDIDYALGHVWLITGSLKRDLQAARTVIVSDDDVVAKILAARGKEA